MSTPTLQVTVVGAPVLPAGATQGFGLYVPTITASNYFSIIPYTPSGAAMLNVNTFGRLVNADGTVIGIANVTNAGSEDVPLWFCVMTDVSGQADAAKSAAARAVVL